MESYLIKSSICLIALYLLYKVIFQNEKNHQLQRWVGLICIIFSCVFLFIPLGSLLVADTYPQIINVVYMQGSDGIQEGISKVITEEVTSIYLTLYLIGVVFFGLRFIYGIGKLVYWYVSSNKTQQWGFQVVHVSQRITPFTFFHLLFLNQELTDDEAMDSLIVHEQYHRDQYHSVDTLFLELLAILFWFNPAIWLFKRDMKTVHEYLADAQVLNKGFDPLRYQYLLFQTKTAIVLPLVNHLSNHTNLKKRITMMNQKRTKSRKSYLKALFFVPIMTLILVFSGFTEANHNLANEIKEFRLIQAKDTVPSKKDLENEKFQFHLTKALKSKDNKQPLYILKDGKKERTITLKDVKKMYFDKIESVNVLKGPAAKKLYGEKGKNGIVIIQLKENKDG